MRGGERLCEGDATGGERGLEVGDGEGVFGIAGLLAVDADAGGEGQSGCGAVLAGEGD